MQVFKPRRLVAVVSALLFALLLVGGCSNVGTDGSSSSSSSGSGSTKPPPPPPPPPPPAPISISTSSLPNGQVSHSYTATLQASGGTAPLSWSTTAGALPTGLGLTASTGVISGTPTATAAGTSLTFTVTDSSSTPQTKSVTLTLNVSPASITVAVSPPAAGLTPTQTLAVSATTNDYAGVNWTVSPAGAPLSATSSASGVNVTFTAPATAGVYTITATSITDSTQSAALSVGVTGLAGVYTYHNDPGRSGANTQEYALTSSNVNTTTFAKLFSCTVDGAVYAQPLWVANLAIDGASHNVILVATNNDSLYAFDADTSPCLLLWQVSLLDAAHGGTAGESTANDLGVIGSPVIDPTTNTLFAVARSTYTTATSTTGYYHRLHAIDITTGNERSGAPVIISATAPRVGGTVTFNPAQQLQRAGLALSAGTVYVAFGSNADSIPWNGWLLGYSYDANGGTPTLGPVLNTTPNQNGGGIWMAGGAPAVDNLGNLYLGTGNGVFDASTATSAELDYGDSLLQLNGALSVNGYFTPSDQATDASKDLDFGSSGATMIVNLDSGPFAHILVAGGKDGSLYVLNGDNLGGYGDSFALQGPMPLGGALLAPPAFWNNTLYIGAVGGPLQAFSFNPSTDQLSSAATSQSPTNYGATGSKPGPGLAVSAAGTSAGAVVWSIDTSANCFGQAAACGPAILHAYDAGNLGSELWNSTMVASDAAGNAVKFTVPTVANGKVYVGTRGNNTGGASGSTTISGEVDVYGLKPD